MKKLTIEEFLQKAKEVHGDKYDYSKVNYVNYKTKVCIICPEHGEFWQTPGSHLNGNGCPKCCKTGVKLTIEEFLQKAKEVHGDKYDYSKVNYINARTKVCIICPEHGEFWQTPYAHTIGQGCPKCANKNKTIEEFLQKAKEIHGDKYDYSKIDFKNYSTKVCIVCHEKDKFGEEHGEFWQLPIKHLNGQGCPNCQKSILSQKVEMLLNKYNIQYIKEKTFDWLKYKSNLYLDFYLPDYKLAIECQGKQHFLENCTFGNSCPEDLEIREKRDNIKYQLCNNHEIKLIYFTNVKFECPYPVIRTEEDLIKEILISIKNKKEN